MFIGHYAAAFALKGKEPKASLGMLFIATQFVDILFFPFVLLGIEHLEFVEGYTAVNNFKMEYPLTHSLLASLMWSLSFYIAYRYGIVRNKLKAKSIALVMALAVISHWFADLLVHSPDLPLVSGHPKFGLGLWNSKWLTFSLESGLLGLGIWYYYKKTKVIKPGGRYLPLSFGLFMIMLSYLNLFVLPTNDNIKSLTFSALASYFVLALIASWIGRKRG